LPSRLPSWPPSWQRLTAMVVNLTGGPIVD